MKPQQVPKSQKIPFSKFRLDTAYKALNLRRLNPWDNQKFEEIQPSNTFQNYLKCQWNNNNDGRSIEVFGIVTNGESWKFYKFTLENQVYEAPLYSFENLPKILGILNMIFKDCDRNLSQQ